MSRLTLVAIAVSVAALASGAGLAPAQATSTETAVSAAATGATPYEVRATSRSELWPSSDGSYVAWAQNSPGAPRRFRALVRTPSGNTFRLNRPGTNGFPGGIDSGRIVFREIKRGQSNIRLFDLVSRKRMALPDQVNTRAKEWAPTLSGDRLLFGREERISRDTWSWKIYLWNLSTGGFEVLARSTTAALLPGQVNGDWVTWASCGKSCNVVRYRISTGARSRIPAAQVAYSPSVAADGTVYFAISGKGCGNDVGFYRYPVGGPGALLFTLPEGRDILSSYAYGSDPTQVVFARVNCPRPGGIFKGDIYGSSIPATVDPPNPRPNPAIEAGSVTYQVDTGHSGRSATSTLDPPLRRLWTTTIGMTPSYPLLAENKVFALVRNNESYGNRLYALDAGTGEQIWFRNVPGVYYWAGIAYENGRVFILNGDGDLVAVDASNGEELWATDLPGQYSFSSEPTAEDGIVYTAGSGSGGTLYAVRAEDGSVLWTKSIDNGDHTSPALSATSVFTSHACTSVYAFDRLTGVERWHHQTGCSGGGGNTPVYHDDYLYVRDWDTGSVFEADSGTLVDTFLPGSAPALAGDSMYNVRRGVLEARGVPGGSREWLFKGDGNLYIAPVTAAGRVYVGSLSGKLYALSRRSGNVVWKTDVGPAIRGPDEHNVSEPVAGFGLGEAILVVPNGRRLTAYVNRR